MEVNMQKMQMKKIINFVFVTEIPRPENREIAA